MTEKELSNIDSTVATSLDGNKGGVTISVTPYQEEKPNLGYLARFADSFKRYETNINLDPNLTQSERTAILTANAPLRRTLKNRHLQMIAIGGAIGAGLFVGSGSRLSRGGPAGVLIGYSLVGTFVYTTCQALGELAVTFPISGGFMTYNIRFIDPSWGFAMSWNYIMGGLIIVPLELIAASLTIGYWNTTINPAAFVVIFYVLIVVLNLFGVRGYGEAESIFSLIKVITIIGFIFFGVIVICGGGPSGEYIGTRYYNDPGAFANGFKGVASVFVSAAFAFAGTEVVGIAAAEAENPRKSVPKAIKQVFWRITLFYVISLLLVGLLVPYDDPRLLSGTSSIDAKASPFVLAIQDIGVRGLPSVMNAVIMIAVLSVGISSVYGTSRTLVALADANQAPKIFNYIDKMGRPLFGILLIMVFGLLSFLVASSDQVVVFNWMLAISGLSSLFTWLSICLSHIRFRRAMNVQGRNSDEIIFSAQTGIWGSIYGATLIILVLIAQFWVALFPIGGTPNASDFFQSYLSFPVVLFFYLGHKIWTNNWILFIRAKDIDIDTGRRDLDLEVLKQELAHEKEIMAGRNIFIRWWNFWC